MKRPAQNFFVDAVSFVLFVWLVATGVVMMFVLPPGSGRLTTLWGLDRHQWGDIHFWIAISFMGLLALHLVLHWKWIVCMIKGKPQKETRARGRVALGTVGLVALLALAAALVLTPAEQVRREEGPYRRGQALHEQVRTGTSITLGDLEYATGVPVVHLRQRLGLPEHLSRDESLHSLHERYAIEIEDVRRILREYGP